MNPTAISAAVVISANHVGPLEDGVVQLGRGPAVVVADLELQIQS